MVFQFWATWPAMRLSKQKRCPNSSIFFCLTKPIKQRWQNNIPPAPVIVHNSPLLSAVILSLLKRHRCNAGLAPWSLLGWLQDAFLHQGLHDRRNVVRLFAEYVGYFPRRVIPLRIVLEEFQNPRLDRATFASV